MEPNPIGVSDKEYIADREVFIRRADPQERAIFILMENIWKLEKSDDGERRHKFSWGHGISTVDYLFMAIGEDGDPSLLPIPHRDHHFQHNTAFFWRVINPADGSTMESFDMRILFDDGQLVLRANLGELNGVQDNVEGLTDGIDYPIRIWDDWGYVFEYDPNSSGDAKDIEGSLKAYNSANAIDVPDPGKLKGPVEKIMEADNASPTK